MTKVISVVFHAHKILRVFIAFWAYFPLSLIFPVLTQKENLYPFVDVPDRMTLNTLEGIKKVVIAQIQTLQSILIPKNVSQVELNQVFGFFLLKYLSCKLSYVS